MRSMVEGDIRMRHGCVARPTPSTIAFGDGPPPRTREDSAHTQSVSFHC